MNVLQVECCISISSLDLQPHPVLHDSVRYNYKYIGPQLLLLRGVLRDLPYFASVGVALTRVSDATDWALLYVQTSLVDNSGSNGTGVLEDILEATLARKPDVVSAPRSKAQPTILT